MSNLSVYLKPLYCQQFNILKNKLAILFALAIICSVLIANLSFLRLKYYYHFHSLTECVMPAYEINQILQYLSTRYIGTQNEVTSVCGQTNVTTALPKALVSYML